MKLVHVEWLDSHRTVAWEPVADALEGAAAMLHCDSAGWLVADEETHIAIAPHVQAMKGDESNAVCGVVVIPRVAVVSIQELAAGSLLSGGRGRAKRPARTTSRRRNG